MFCTNCGKPIADGARFCTNCGQAVQPDMPAPEAVSDVPVSQSAASPASEVPVAPPPSIPDTPTPETPAPETFIPETPVPEVPASAQGIPPAPPAAPKQKKAGGHKKKVVLTIVIVVLVALILAVGGWLAIRAVSSYLAARLDYETYVQEMTAGTEQMANGDYQAAVDAFEEALTYQPEDPDATLALAEAYLGSNRLADARQTLSDLALDPGDSRLPQWEQLTAIATLDPAITEVDASSFPTITVTMQKGSSYALTTDHLSLTENGSARQLDNVTDNGSTVTFTYRTEDTDVSQETRDLELTVRADMVTYDSDSSYTTPYFEPAQLELISTDVSNYPIVKTYFRVANASTGEAIENLNINSFTILENVEGGEYLAREVKSATPLKGNAGLNIGLVADKSDSISSSDMRKIKNVMTEFVNSLHYNVGDKAELLAFDSIVQQMCYYTNDASLLVNGINNMSTDGMTAFYDAVYNSITNAALQGGARCVIAFTDGMDNRSKHTSNEVVQYANAKQVPVYIIGVGNGVEEHILRSMAESTGGRYWYIDDLYDLQEIFNQIYSEQQDLYVVEYESDASLDAYQTRTVSVQVSGSGFRGKTEESFTPVRSIKDGGAISADRYVLVTECLSWEEASRRCQEMGGHLATITSQDEMDLLISMSEDANMKYVWLGGYTSYDDDGNVFGHWVTGEDFSYQAWCVDEPSRVDHDGIEEWYIMLWNIPSLGGWNWNDQRNDPAAVITSMADKMAFICEFEN